MAPPINLPLRAGLGCVIALATGLAVGIVALTSMPGRSFAGPRPPLSADELSSRERLRTDLETLSTAIGERHDRRYDTLIEAARWVESRLRESGLAATRRYVDVDARPFFNLEARLGPVLAEGAKTIVVGAHYDSARGSPGADDNASGVAVALELARLLASEPPASEVRVAFFVNEEPPHFRTTRMGSLEHARQLADEGVQVEAMISLDAVGCYSDAPGSQSYPLQLLSWVYPRRGDFVAFVGDLSSRTLVRRAIGAFREAAPIPSEGLVAPDLVPGVGWSDHWSFWQQGVPAILVSSTAYLRNRNYHEPSDTADTVDVDALARVAHGLRHVVEVLAGRHHGADRDPGSPR